LRPEQPFSSMLAKAFDQGTNFIVQSKVIVPPNDEDGMPEELLSSKFILNDQCFVDLQIYLKSAMRLPGTTDYFKQSFPEEWFKDYFEADKERPKLYDVCSDLVSSLKSTLLTYPKHMRDTLVDINQHCAEFWKDTMGPMVTLG
jgi:hypothetical protein